MGQRGRRKQGLNRECGGNRDVTERTEETGMGQRGRGNRDGSEKKQRGPKLFIL